MKDRIEEIARGYIQAWKSGGRRHVVDQLSGHAADREIAPDEVAAITAWMMTNLPTWVDQIELRDDLLDIARSGSHRDAVSARPR